MIRTLLLLFFAINIANGLPETLSAYEYFPYMVSINHRGSLKASECGGSIIAKRTILTAAHCITGVNYRDVYVIAGIINVSDNGPKYRADELIIHPEYNSTLHANDIGLIIVSREIEYTGKVGSIKIDTIYETKDFNSYVVGWGKSGSNLTAYNTLKYLYVRKVNDLNCEPELRDKYTEMCIYTRLNEGLCTRDDGNAVVYRNKVVGVVSRINDPCGDERPQIVSRISGFYIWINNNMQQ